MSSRVKARKIAPRFPVDNRQSSLQNSVGLVFMEHGRIIDVGTARDLEERQPAFRVSLEKAAAQEEAEVEMA